MRYPVLIVMTLLLCLYAWQRGHSPRSLGFRQDTWVRALFWNGVLTAVGAALVVTLLALGQIQRRPEPIGHMLLFFVFYALFSSPVQEFLFRSLLFAEMNAAGLKHRTLQVWLSAATFGFIHVIYPNPVIWAATFLVGICWGIIYVRYPNYWAITLSHAVLGAIAITLGLIWVNG